MKKSRSVSTPLRMAAIAAVICGLVFPGIATAIGQFAFPYQANGEPAILNNRTVGSYLVGQSSNSSYLFNIRNNSASGVDPDITVATALLQAQEIHNYTHISLEYLHSLIRNNTKRILFFFGTPYVNVLVLNIKLIEHFHSTVGVYNRMYENLTGS